MSMAWSRTGFCRIFYILHEDYEKSFPSASCALISISKETKVAVTFILSSWSQVSACRVLAACIRTFTAWSYGCTCVSVPSVTVLTPTFIGTNRIVTHRVGSVTIVSVSLTFVDVYAYTTIVSLLKACLTATREASYSVSTLCVGAMTIVCVTDAFVYVFTDDSIAFKSRFLTTTFKTSVCVIAEPVVLMAVMGSPFAFIDIFAYNSTSLKSHITCAFKGANGICTRCLAMAIMSASLAFVDIFADVTVSLISSVTFTGIGSNGVCAS